MNQQVSSINKKSSNVSSAGSRKKLLEAAENLILDKGLHTLTVRSLAAAAKVNISMISYNFDGMDGLLVEVFNQNFEKLTEIQKSLLLNLQEKQEVIALNDIVEIMVLSIWREPVYAQEGHASMIVQEIYRHASESVQKKATQQLKTGFEPMVNLLAPLLPHLDEQQLLWRLCCFCAANTSMIPRSPLWELYKSFPEHGSLDKDFIVRSMIAFGVAALSNE